jgi:hypothetical protein
MSTAASTAAMQSGRIMKTIFVQLVKNFLIRALL